ncbi:hypothetical protein LTR40_007737, partial [Exophiala xenobiotica]
MPLLRRFSSSFKKHKATPNNKDSANGNLTPVDEADAPKQNGTQAGSSVAQSLEKTKDVHWNSSYNPPSPPAAQERVAGDASGPATRKDVENIFQQFAQLLHASQRPLPTQSGDGQYLDEAKPSGFLADLKSLGLKDVKTVTHMLEDKA